MRWEPNGRTCELRYGLCIASIQTPQPPTRTDTVQDVLVAFQTFVCIDDTPRYTKRRHHDIRIHGVSDSGIAFVLQQIRRSLSCSENEGPICRFRRERPFYAFARNLAVLSMTCNRRKWKPLPSSITVRCISVGQPTPPTFTALLEAFVPVHVNRGAHFPRRSNRLQQPGLFLACELRPAE